MQQLVSSVLLLVQYSYHMPVIQLQNVIWLVHRRLRVSVENDMGGTDVAAKIVRLFVPYWLRNDATVPLSCRLVEIEPPRGQQTDSQWLQLASKAAQNAAQLPKSNMGKNSSTNSVASKVVRSLEAIEDAPDSHPLMLSLPSMDNVGLAVALSPAGVFSSAIALKAFEDKVASICTQRFMSWLI